jgi:hypothetical protein
MDETYISKRNYQRNMETNRADRWFNPDFQNFVNTEIVETKHQT